MEEHAHLLLLTASKGNDSAYQFVDTLFDVLHFFDDVADKDKQLSNSDTEQALWKALIELPRNAFYRQYFLDLNPLVGNAIQDWITANAFESKADSENDLIIAYIIRSSYITIMVEVARICGGNDLARTIGEDLRRVGHYEGFREYQSALKTEKQYRATDSARFAED